nr:hypothetical protein [Rhodoferax sp.]
MDRFSGDEVQEIKDFSDERQKAWCIHCGATIATVKTNRDHVPTKSLLDRPFPPDLPQVRVCRQCNTGFSLDEEYFVAFLSCVLAGSTVTQTQTNPWIRRALSGSPALIARLDSARRTIETSSGEEKVVGQPEAERINRVVLKNARGHAFFEFGEPMLTEPVHVWATPLVSLSDQQRVDFENVTASGWPEVGSRMMTRLLSGVDMDDGWVVVQDDVYRYTVLQEGTLLVRSVIRNYLATEVFWD